MYNASLMNALDIYGQFEFVANTAPDEPIMQYDIFICRQPLSKSIAPQSIDIWLYKDLTAYYKKIPGSQYQSCCDSLYGEELVTVKSFTHHGTKKAF